MKKINYIDITNVKSLVSEFISKFCFDKWKVCVGVVKIRPTVQNFSGDISVALHGLSKNLSVEVEILAKELGEHIIKKIDLFDSYNLANGFLNLLFKPQAVLNFLNNIEEFFTTERESQKKHLLVEFSSPNTNKPLHLGHLRNNFIGQAISNILSYVGYKVTKVCVVNDRGIHICKSMAAYMLYGGDDTPEKSNLKGDFFVGKYYVLFDKKYKEEVAALISDGVAEDNAKKNAAIMLKANSLLLLWEKQDSATIELWKKMNAWVYDGFESTYDKIGIYFDKIYYESQTYLLGKEVVAEGLKNGVFFKNTDGSIAVDLSGYGLDSKVLMRNDDTSIYITQDLGMADLRYKEFNFDKCFYVVGNEQDYHFDVLFKILKILKRSYADNLFHLSYGMVELPTGKMKSREGTVVDADNLIDETVALAKIRTQELGKVSDLSNEEAELLHKTIALAALKYQLLKVEFHKKIVFDPKESIDLQGNTGPFLQYTYVRIISILSKIEHSNREFTIPDNLTLTDFILEREVIKANVDFLESIETAADTFAPNIIANSLFTLCKQFNKMYAVTNILFEKDINKQNIQISIIEKVAKSIKLGLSLLGIDVPPKM